MNDYSTSGGNGERPVTASEDPVVGSWYSDRDGDLVRVRLAGYWHEELKTLLLEYLDGQLEIVTLDTWYKMELHRDMLSVSQQHVSS